MNTVRLAAFLAAATLSVLAAPAPAAIKTQDIEYKDGETVLMGYLAYDDAAALAKTKRPGILVVHEWWGLNDYAKSRARQLAELGYVAFAADVYGKGVLAKDAKEAGELAGKFKKDRKLLRSRVNAALDTLAKQETVDPDKLAAIGYCFGGTAVLELARSGAKLAGVVSFHGGLDTPDPADAKNIKAKVLVLTGADDPAVPAKQREEFMDEMRKGGVNYEMTLYGGAVHAFTNPASGSDNSKGAAYNEQADKRSWQAMKDFFAELFPPPAAPKT